MAASIAPYALFRDCYVLFREFGGLQPGSQRTSHQRPSSSSPSHLFTSDPVYAFFLSAAQNPFVYLINTGLLLLWIIFGWRIPVFEAVTWRKSPLKKELEEKGNEIKKHHEDYVFVLEEKKEDVCKLEEAMAVLVLTSEKAGNDRKCIPRLKGWSRKKKPL
ncbi:unnamed protein product [Cyprideis torosa]|uniref:Uncharacterized protein n=1 Tax=Cyprideis torosa TaxID=163714 RepID=A0A7R8ZLG7_9CRUS|nr:unnamed protein product [Cyprideis torosa]CAG0893135.1 unnamed protein product [Cyprideis torosa]